MRSSASLRYWYRVCLGIRISSTSRRTDFLGSREIWPQTCLFKDAKRKRGKKHLSKSWLLSTCETVSRWGWKNNLKTVMKIILKVFVNFYYNSRSRGNSCEVRDLIWVFKTLRKESPRRLKSIGTYKEM